MTNDNIQELLDEYLSLYESPRNQALLRDTWAQPGLAYLDDIGVPKAGAVPIVAVPHLSMWSRKMNRSIADLFTDPSTYLEVFLSREIGRFKTIQDDRPIQKTIFIFLGCGFESTLLGAKQLYSESEDPWVDRTPVLQEPADLDKLELPDFKRTGLMPIAHRFYENISELVHGHGFKIGFSDWWRSPFSVASQIRGMEALLMDIGEQPAFVVRLLDFLVDCMIHYRTQCAEFAGNNLGKTMFYNDEVNVPSMSPNAYRDLILPSEKRCSEAFDGLTYWHSCGNVTPMIPTVREVPNITIFHVGPWTDLSAAIDSFGDGTLDVCVDSVDDVYQASEDRVRAKVTDILHTCQQRGAKSFSIRPGILQAFQSLDKDLDSVARWVRVAKETVLQVMSQETESVSSEKAI